MGNSSARCAGLRCVEVGQDWQESVFVNEQWRRMEVFDTVSIARIVDERWRNENVMMICSFYEMGVHSICPSVFSEEHGRMPVAVDQFHPRLQRTLARADQQEAVQRAEVKQKYILLPMRSKYLEKKGKERKSCLRLQEDCCHIST